MTTDRTSHHAHHAHHAHADRADTTEPADLVRELADSLLAGHSARAPGPRVPSLAAIDEMLTLARRLLFPGYFEPEPLAAGQLALTVHHLSARLLAHLRTQIELVTRYACAAPLTNAAPPSPASAPAIAAAAQPPVPAPPPPPPLPAPLADTANPHAPWRARLTAAGLLPPCSQPDQPAALSPADCADLAQRITARFARRLPDVRRLLTLDVAAAFVGDPAAEHPDEIVLCYPGLLAILHHRLAHELYRLGVPLLPRIIAESAHRSTGIDIHPGAAIGESFFIDHGAGTVIGQTAVIGRHCKIYQGVTLGARSFPTDQHGNLIRHQKRHPTLQDRVTVYAGAVILGGDTVIGHDSIISGGVFLSSSIPPHTTVRQPRPETSLHQHSP